MRDDELRRRRAPGREILGRVRIADERRVIAADECAVQRRAHAFVRLRADDDEAPDGEVGEDGLERRLLERVRIPLRDEWLALVRAQLGDDLPLLASRRKVVARVLHPDDRNLRGASLVDDGADFRDDCVPLVGALHDAVLHVDHEHCSVRAVLECRHRLPLVASSDSPTLAGVESGKR